MTTDTADSYRVHASGNHCALLGSDPGHVCWGQVRSVDSNPTGDGENAQVWHLYACQGHKDKVLKGWREKYIREEE